MTDFHFASFWESVADTVPDATASVCGEATLAWQDFERRAARFASALTELGLGVGAKVGLYLPNRNEYSEAQFGIFKARACPVNINYRYQADELVSLLAYADAEAVVFDSRYRDMVDGIQSRLPAVKGWFEVGGAGEKTAGRILDYEREILTRAPQSRRRRSGDDIYMLFTGGTTGLPKGVMYRHGDYVPAIFSAMGRAGIRLPESHSEVGRFVRDVRNAGMTPVVLSACPLMHGTGMSTGCLFPLTVGGTSITLDDAGLDAGKMLETIERCRVTGLVIVGDAFARPLLQALQRGDRSWDVRSLRSIVSSGAMWSREVKEGLLEFVDASLVDVFSATEGAIGTSVSSRGATADTARFELNEGVKVFDDDDREVPPGSGRVGRVASTGLVPVGYYKDPAKSARTFKEIGGVRYAFAGDLARVTEGGQIQLLGRGNSCINTMGEKVFPEEVESVLRTCELVEDALVLGVEDATYGEMVVALIETPTGSLDMDAVVEHCRRSLAGYKVPRRLVKVPEVMRTPSGKADYRWARGYVTALLEDSSDDAAAS